MTRSAPTVAVLDYGSGNVHSAVKALIAAGAQAELTRDATAIARADGLFVPGVGAFDAVMQQLRAVNGPALIAERLDRGAPVLGVCVGLQVLFSRGTEHGRSASGLGHFAGEVHELAAERLPHMGWNTVEVAPQSRLFAGLGRERFYFVHSYAVAAADAPGDARVSFATHDGARFVAAVERGPLSATQFHPEKSGLAGLALLRNWIGQLADASPAPAEPRLRSTATLAPATPVPATPAHDTQEPAPAPDAAASPTRDRTP